MSETPNETATPRTHPWALYRTGHLFQWGSNDPGDEPKTLTEMPPEAPTETEVSTETPTETEVSTDPAASAWFTGKARTPK